MHNRSMYCNLGRYAGSGVQVRVHQATTLLQRMAGLFWYGRPGRHRGLWLKPCNAVHTFGLGYAIDVVFLDAAGKVLKTVHVLRPNRFAWCRQAHSVVEFPACYCRRNRYYAAALKRIVYAASGARRGKDSSRC